MACFSNNLLYLCKQILTYRELNLQYNNVYIGIKNSIFLKFRQTSYLLLTYTLTFPFTMPLLLLYFIEE